MRNCLNVLVLTLLTNVVFAQLSSVKPKYIQLGSDEVVEVAMVVYEKPIMQPAVFRTGESQLPASHVKFFKNNNGYFANLMYSDKRLEDRYAMRIRKGSVDLFEEVDIEIYGGEYLAVREDEPETRKLATGQHFDYYCLDGSTIRSANYRNLSDDLGTIPECQKHLRNHKLYKWLQGGLISAGAGLIVGGALATRSDPGFTPTMGLGVILGGLSFFCEVPKDDYLWHAVEAYDPVE